MYVVSRSSPFAYGHIFCHLQMEDDSDLAEVPTKCISSVQNVHIRCKIHHIDFEGRSDGLSIMKVVDTMNPRRAIIVRGREDSCRALAEQCRQVAKQAGGGGSSSKHQTVFIARLGETVDATTESHIYQVRLPESLYGLLEFSRGRDGLLAWVDGYISRMQDEAKDIQQDGEEGGASDPKKAAIPALLPVPEEEAQSHKAVRIFCRSQSSSLSSYSFFSPEQIFVNELKLSDFKLVLTRHGIPSEFNGGVLFCGGQSRVALRRHESGRVTIEGTACPEYYTVRELLYEQYAVV